MQDNSQQAFTEWSQFSHLFHQQEIPARTILLREGEISRKAYAITRGCIRLWFNNNGKDVTFQFFFEGQGVSSIESFKTGQPSLFNMETVEPCTVQTITRADFQTILDSSAAIRQEVEDQIFQRLVYYQQLFLSRIRNSPEERYQELLAHHPQILQRVPQHYIASYLGITPVSLSRIRNRI